MTLDCRLKTEEWLDPWWRLCNLYRAVSDAGKDFKFYPNEVQEQLYHNLWYLNLILKARQQGFTTFIDLILLDQAIFNPNKNCGIIAQTREDAQKVFASKVKYPYEHLPLGLRNARETESDSTQELAFNNGSKVRVGTSMRSDTLQYLHVTEFGKISAKYPEKAAEIKKGAFNTIAPGQYGFVESTAEGRHGEFYEMVKTGRALDAQVGAGEAKLTKLDFKFHFFGWWRKPSNRLDPEGVVITTEMVDYFAKIEVEMGIKLDAQQRAWYVKKSEQQKDDMKAEHPSTPDEAFEVAIEGLVYGKEMLVARADGRITKIPYIRSIPVNTFWDLGLNNNTGRTSILCHQHVAMQDRFLRGYENAGPSLDHYTTWLQGTGYTFGTHYLPHDADAKRLGIRDTRSWKKMLEELMPGHKFVIVPRISDVDLGIKATKAKFDAVCFDEVGCAGAIAAIEAYHRNWSEEFQQYGDPVHDGSSNYADAFRQFGQANLDRKAASSIPKIPQFRPHDAGAGY